MDKQKGLELKYFVLKPNGEDDYAQASRMAMRTYAYYITTENPELAKDLLRWVDEIEKLGRGAL